MPDLLERLRTALADRYAVESEIGRGGMAVVYLAQDLRHDRRVAIKVLLPELTATLGGERFLQEIKTVASLQHPHILPLYDSGEAGGLLYYVMPYAEGESLRHRLDRAGQMAVDESVRIAIEVADGLDYAHRQGVVHRDIKPANILLAEGHATIADFGLARAIEAARGDRVTSTGLGVGTPLYASPEQATAQETLDGRTDIYSLGCVLYEMLAGEPPITGVTPKMIHARRMAETPTPLHSVRDTVTPATDHAVARALARVPADRYATAGEFRKALQAVLLAVTPTGVGETISPPDLSTSGRGASRLKRLGIPVASGAAIVIAAVLLWLWGNRDGQGPLEITVSSTTDVTNAPGVEYLPAISPDGNEVAYVASPGGGPQVFVRSTTESGGGLRPADGGGDTQLSPVWTSDGASIRFCVYSFPHCDWKEVGKFGGFVQTVDPSRRSFSMGWSRDGTQAAYAVADSVYSVSTGNSEPELLGVHLEGAWHPNSFSWSPDGRWIAYVGSNPLWVWGLNTANSSIWLMDANGGEPIRVTTGGYQDVSPQWLPDSRHLLFVSDRDGARGISLVEVGPEGARSAPRTVIPSSDPHTISVSADGKRLAYSRFIEKQNVWSVRIPDSGTVSIKEAEPVTTGTQVVEMHAVSPDGEWIAYDSKRRRQFDIYKLPLNGGSPELVADVSSHAYEPDWSPDGTEVAFYSGNGEVFTVSADGGAPVVAADFAGFDGSPRWSPDGLAIAFESEGPRAELPNKVWIVSRDSVDAPWGEPVQLTDFRCGVPDWAPDGETLVCERGRTGWARVSRDGTVLWNDWLPSGLRGVSRPRFSPDGSRIYFAARDDAGWEGIWWIPAGGGDPTRIVSFDDSAVIVFGSYLSVGPEHLYFTIDENESDIRVVDLEW